MTIEYVLLLFIFATMVMGAFVRGPKASFRDAGPKLGARVEYHLATGEGFKGKDGRASAWVKPRK